jgi:hypothetical protein
MNQISGVSDRLDIRKLRLFDGRFRLLSLSVPQALREQCKFRSGSAVP